MSLSKTSVQEMITNLEAEETSLFEKLAALRAERRDIVSAINPDTLIGLELAEAEARYDQIVDVIADTSSKKMHAVSALKSLQSLIELL